MEFEEYIELYDNRDLIRQARERNPEALFLVGLMILNGEMSPIEGKTSEESGMIFLVEAARRGYYPARIKLNKICFNEYNRIYSKVNYNRTGPLVDFDGKPIRINKTGIKTPVDAELFYKNGKNILKLSVDLQISARTSDLKDVNRYVDAIVDGVKAWEGTYTVFGGQTLEVVLDVTVGKNETDNVLVSALTQSIKIDLMKELMSNNLSPEKRAWIEELVFGYRSFTRITGDWNTQSKKEIHLNIENFGDYDTITSIVKHEFGHVLGLGDLYSNKGDGLSGVDEGTFRELDFFCVTENDYNLVMCDHDGPISNNDIEMVVLAFLDEEIQLYQKQDATDKISKALGRGN